MGGASAGLWAMLARQEQMASGSRLYRALRLPVRAIRSELSRVSGSRGRWSPRPVTARLFWGQSMKVVLPDDVSRQLYLYGFYEADLTRMILSRLGRGGVFVDVGAHYGYHAMLASHLVGESGWVVAFEATPRTYQILKENLGDRPNARIENLAVHSREGTCEIHDFGAALAGFNSLLPEPRPSRGDRPAASPRSSHMVDCVTLDRYFEGLPVSPDFIKIDVESMEFHVLTGMRRLLSEHGPTVSIETGDFGVAGADESRQCVSHLISMGYRPFEWGPGGIQAHEPVPRYGYGNLLFIRE